MTQLIIFNKPYDVQCQFSEVPGVRTLADYIPIPGVYPAGRLDRRSEGLVVLTDDGRQQARISDPRHKLPKTYWVQVEGDIDARALEHLSRGVKLNDGMTRPAVAERMETPLPPRDPPIRFRKQIPTSWLRLTLREGRNRQVRRMTAAVGYPTLRLYRFCIGDWTTEGIEPGCYRLEAARDSG